MEHGPDPISTARSREQPRNKPARILDALIIMAIVFGVQIVLEIPEFILGRLGAKLPPTLTIPLDYVVELVVVFLVLKRKLHTNLIALVPIRKAGFFVYAAAVLGSVGLVLLVPQLEVFLTRLLPVTRTVRALFEPFQTSTDLATVLVTAAIIGPAVEEILFRAIILDGFARCYGRTKGLILSSLLFGVSHLNPWQLLAATLLGLIIGIVYLRSQSILPGFVIHGLYNALLQVLTSLRIPYAHVASIMLSISRTNGQIVAMTLGATFIFGCLSILVAATSSKGPTAHLPST